MIEELKKECRHQENSCLYTSTTLFNWLKSLRRWRAAFIILPIITGSLASFVLFQDMILVPAVLSLLTGIFPAIFKALKLDVHIETVEALAAEYKILESRFRQAAEIVSAKGEEALETELSELMRRVEKSRAQAITPPERFYRKAQKDIKKGDYEPD